MNHRPATRTRGIVFTLLLLAQATAAHAEDGATRFLQERHRSVQKILDESSASDAAKKAREARLSEALRQLLDLQELSRRALADHWDGLAAAQRDEFVSLLSQLVERNYQKNLESTLEYAVRYTGEAALGDGILVRTLARSKKNRRAPEVSIDYAVRRADGSFRVYDVTTDGVSLVDNYRKQFDRIIRRDGWNALVERMRKKAAGGSEL